MCAHICIITVSRKLKSKISNKKHRSVSLTNLNHLLYRTEDLIKSLSFKSSLNHWESIYAKLMVPQIHLALYWFRCACKNLVGNRLIYPFYFAVVKAHYQSRLFCSTLAREVGGAYFSWISDNFTYLMVYNPPLQGVLKWIPRSSHKLGHPLNWWCQKKFRITLFIKTEDYDKQDHSSKNKNLNILRYSLNEVLPILHA